MFVYFPACSPSINQAYNFYKNDIQSDSLWEVTSVWKKTPEFCLTIGDSLHPLQMVPGSQGQPATCNVADLSFVKAKVIPKSLIFVSKNMAVLPRSSQTLGVIAWNYNLGATSANEQIIWFHCLGLLGASCPSEPIIVSLLWGYWDYVNWGNINI